MNDKIDDKKNFILDILIIFLSILPLWLFENKNFLNFQIIIFFFIFFFTLVFILLILQKTKKKIYSYFFLSIFIFYGYDSKIGFYSIFIESLKNYNQFLKYLIPTIFLFTSIILIVFLLIKLRKLKEFFIFSLLSIFIINIYSFISFENKNFELENIKIEKQEIHKSNNKKNIIIYLDSYISLDAIDRNIPYGIKAKESVEKLFSDHNFTLYSSAYSIYDHTFKSISSSLNFDFQTDKLNHNQYIKRIFFDKSSHYEIKKNIFFDINSEKKILSYKGLSDYCKSHNTKCLYSNPVNNYKKYMDGFEFNTFDYVISKTHNQKSLLFQYIWRAGKRIKLFNHYYDLTFHKVKIENDLNNYAYILKNTDFDVYFLHLISPHPPYVYEINENEQKCSFSSKVYSDDFAHYSAKSEKILEQYYKEIICTNKFLDKFLKKLTENNSHIINTKILFISDHGIPTEDEKNLVLKNMHSTLFAIQNEEKKFKINREVISSQELFSKYFNKNHIRTNNNNKKIYSEQENKFIVLPFFN